ncbi:MAG TPA: hypothetical protein PKE55_02590 [Kiritimatiellia bacterium]|nr:hypothetical protein [Kiritimatiellia bacterium]
MTLGGWIVMIGSVGFVTGLLTWCVYKVVTIPEATKHIHGQLDVDTRDT